MVSGAPLSPPSVITTGASVKVVAVPEASNFRFTGQPSASGLAAAPYPACWMSRWSEKIDSEPLICASPPIVIARRLPSASDSTCVMTSTVRRPSTRPTMSSISVKPRWEAVAKRRAEVDFISVRRFGNRGARDVLARVAVGHGPADRDLDVPRAGCDGHRARATGQHLAHLVLPFLATCL
ncbi:hypothetical protein D3C86_1151360 [compost metagenome]